MNQLFKIFLLILIPLTSFPQTHELEGKIQDSLQNGIPNTNIIATPLDTDDEITFSISDQKGRYRLILSEHSRYLVEITHLGFKKISDTIQISEDQTQNFTLQESTESLEEVLIRQEMAVIVKEDTITYRTDQFKTGEERKLRDVLKKLPGVEVDREGNVKVNGKSVTKLMVDGKTFFTGDEKLGVNNIPADAVDEVEALDNYNDVAFLKGLEDSDKMALNIKLKDGKKKFAFGDVEAGAGIENRFLAHPKLFYYSPKTAVNLIGDFNNIGQKSFTVQDYLDFEGGFGLALEDPSTYFNLYSDEFAQFLREDEFTYSKNDFAAASLSQDLGRNFSLDAYSIFNKGKLRTKTVQDISYQSDSQADEFRNNTGQNDLLFSINKIKLRYDNMDNVDLRTNTTIKYNDGESQSNLSSLVQNNEEFVNTNNQPRQLEFTQTLNLNTQFSYKHTTKAEITFKHSESNNNRLWDFNEALFTDIMPLVVEDDSFQLEQDHTTKLNNIKLNAKHYWVLADFHHIYPVAGFNYFNTEFNTLDRQILNDGSINSFEDAGFNNRLDFSLLDAYVGFQYKTQIDDLVLRPGLVVHNYNWNVAQFSNEIANENKMMLLPEFFAEYEFNSSKKIKLEYNRYSNFSKISQFANRLRLQSFNQLYRGNSELENQIYNRIRLNYRNFNMFRGLIYFINLSYSHREQSIRNLTEIDGIDQISTSIYTDLPENTYSISGNINKRISDYRLSFGTNFSFSDYSRIINNETLDYQNNNYGYNLKVQTRYDEWPNLEVGFRHSFSELSSENSTNEFMRITPFAILEYDFFEDFIFKFNYDYNYFENQSTNNINRFEIAESSLFYSKEDSAWGFEIQATNLFDVSFKRENSVNEFIVADRRIFLQPRTILFKLIYKL